MTKIRYDLRGRISTINNERVHYSYSWDTSEIYSLSAGINMSEQEHNYGLFCCVDFYSRHYLNMWDIIYMQSETCDVIYGFSRWLTELNFIPWHPTDADKDNKNFIDTPVNMLCRVRNERRNETENSSHTSTSMISLRITQHLLMYL